MPKVIITDTSTLILFSKIDELAILQKVYGELLTTPQIVAEYGSNLPAWIKIEAVSDEKYQRFLATQVDEGEASAIALATQYNEATLLLDDLKARKLAQKLGFKVSGTLGVIHKAKQLSIIEKVKPLLDKLLLTDFRISDNIIKEILRLNNE